MQRFFEIAIMMTIVISFINGGLIVFGEPLMDKDFSGLQDSNVMVKTSDVTILKGEVENTAKEEGAFTEVIDFLGGIVGGIGQVGGGIATTINKLFAFGNAYTMMFKAMFNGIDTLYCDEDCIAGGGSLGFLQLTLIPLINLMQILAVTYIFIYIISAIRGGGA